jgi:hypothetical protein
MKLSALAEMFFNNDCIHIDHDNRMYCIVKLSGEILYLSEVLDVMC